MVVLSFRGGVNPAVTGLIHLQLGRNEKCTRRYCLVFSTLSTQSVRTVQLWATGTFGWGPQGVLADLKCYIVTSQFDVLLFGRQGTIYSKQWSRSGQRMFCCMKHFFLFLGVAWRNHSTVPAVLAAPGLNLWDPGCCNCSMEASLFLYFGKQTPDYSHFLPTTGQVEDIVHPSMQWQ